MYPKNKPFRSARMRTSARGQECHIRIPGVCNGDSETVVLCHAPHDMNKATSQKPDDIGAWGCSSCHDEIDSRSRVLNLTRDERMAVFYEGAHRTWAEMMRQGILSA